jgi:hypothetical protein
MLNHELKRRFCENLFKQESSPQTEFQLQGNWEAGFTTVPLGHATSLHGNGT